MSDPAFIKGIPGYFERRYPPGEWGLQDRRIENLASLIMEGMGDLDDRLVGLDGTVDALKAARLQERKDTRSARLARQRDRLQAEIDRLNE